MTLGVYNAAAARQCPAICNSCDDARCDSRACSLVFSPNIHQTRHVQQKPPVHGFPWCRSRSPARQGEPTPPAVGKFTAIPGATGDDQRGNGANLRTAGRASASVARVRCRRKRSCVRFFEVRLAPVRRIAGLHRGRERRPALVTGDIKASQASFRDRECVVMRAAGAPNRPPISCSCLEAVATGSPRPRAWNRVRLCDQRNRLWLDERRFFCCSMTNSPQPADDHWPRCARVSSSLGGLHAPPAAPAASLQGKPVTSRAIRVLERPGHRLVSSSKLRRSINACWLTLNRPS
jgi:hypothetical protein